MIPILGLMEILEDPKKLIQRILQEQMNSSIEIAVHYPKRMEVASEVNFQSIEQIQAYYNSAEKYYS